MDGANEVQTQRHALSRGTGTVAVSRRHFLLLPAAASPIAAAQEEFWKIKPPGEWSAGEVYRLVNQSPWAHRVQSWNWTNQAVPKLGPLCVVTWESAQPVREARKTLLPAEFADSFVVGVDGLPLGDTPYFDYLSGSTVLRCSGNPKWTASVSPMKELIRTSAVFAFGFSREGKPIRRESGDLIFETQVGRWRIRTRFKPKDMLYHGRLAL